MVSKLCIAVLAGAAHQTSGFVTTPGFSASITEQSGSRVFLQQGATQGASEGTSAYTSACVGLLLGISAGLVGVARSKTARRAIAEPKAITDGQFAGGLVGTEHHGWGTYQWDPARLADRYPEHLPWYREAELKHGRVAMLAIVGLVAPDFIRIPVNECTNSNLDILNAHKMLIGPGLGEGPMWWLLVFCAVIESARFKQLGLGFENLTLENAGDLNFGKGFLPETEEGKTLMKIKELKNGRLAMLAFSGAITQAAYFEYTHFPWAPMP